MTETDAIDRIQMIAAVANGEIGLSKADMEAVRMAVRALEKQGVMKDGN